MWQLWAWFFAATGLGLFSLRESMKSIHIEGVGATGAIIAALFSYFCIQMVALVPIVLVEKPLAIYLVAADFCVPFLYLWWVWRGQNGP